MSNCSQKPSNYQKSSDKFLASKPSLFVIICAARTKPLEKNTRFGLSESIATTPQNRSCNDDAVRECNAAYLRALSKLGLNRYEKRSPIIENCKMLLAAIVGLLIPFIVMFIILILGLIWLKSKGKHNFNAYGLCGTFVSLLVGLLFVAAIQID